MDKLVRQIELPLAKRAAEKAGLYIVPKRRIKELAFVATDAYRDYPLHNWFSGGKYDEYVSEKIMEISLKTMIDDAVICADSEELNGFAVWLPLGFDGSKTLPFLTNGGLKLILHSGFSIIGRLLKYETYAMNLKKEFTGNVDWYLYNLSVKKAHREKVLLASYSDPCLNFAIKKIYLHILKQIKKVMFRCMNILGLSCQKKNLYQKAMLCIMQW